MFKSLNDPVIVIIEILRTYDDFMIYVMLKMEYAPPYMVIRVRSFLDYVFESVSKNK